MDLKRAATLLTSELMANAILYARTTIRVVVRNQDQRVRIDNAASAIKTLHAAQARTAKRTGSGSFSQRSKRQAMTSAISAP